MESCKLKIKTNAVQLGQGLSELGNDWTTFQALEPGRKQHLQRRNVTFTIKRWEGYSRRLL